MIDKRLFSQLPLRFWLQLVAGLVLLGVLAAFGFVLLLGAGLVVLGIALVFQIFSWFSGRPPNVGRTTVIDGEYRVVDRSGKSNGRDADDAGPAGSDRPRDPGPSSRGPWDRR